MSTEERIDRLKLLVFKIAVRTLAFVGGYSLIARYCTRHVQEIENGVKCPLRADAGRDKITVLVLDYERFRGDVDLFSHAEDMRILTISWNLLRFLLASYVHEPTLAEEKKRTSPVGIRWDFACAEPGSCIYAERQRYRRFLECFLPVFLDRLGVDVVMNSDFRYRREADFVRIAAELGYPHICYYREAMYIVSANYHLAVERHKIFSPFYGDLIAVQNEITRRMFLDSAIAAPDKIAVRGCPRMDEFIADLDTPAKSAKDRRRQIAFFSCPRGAQLKDLAHFDFFTTTRHVVRALAELAAADPELRVVIKMKDMHINGQLAELEKEVQRVAGSEQGLPNIQFETGRMAAHDVIRQSDVVCAMQSTVVLEAAIAGKPVILPHFREMRERDGAEEVLMYREYYDLFDVPDNSDTLKALVLERLTQGDIEPHIKTQRRALFEEHVSPLDGGATQKSLDLIRDTARQRPIARISGQGGEQPVWNEPSFS